MTNGLKSVLQLFCPIPIHSIMLNYLWALFFFIGFAVAVVKWLFFQDATVLPQLTKQLFDSAKTGFEISLGLTGVMTLWLGFMRIGEKGGAIQVLVRLTQPFFSRLFPEIPKDHPALGAIFMNFAANMLGLDNAATPLGLKAMKAMQDLNPEKDTASNPQLMFLVLNTAGFTLIPASIIAVRSQEKALFPADVFLPILITTFVGFIFSVILVAIYQKINLLDKILLSWLLGGMVAIGGLVYYLSHLKQDELSAFSNTTSSLLILSIIVSFLGMSLYRQQNVYEIFIEGAKEGFETSVKIIPYLVAMLIGIGVFRAAGAMEAVINGVRWLCEQGGFNSDFVAGLPTALMKPFSGSGARGMMVDAIKTYGVDSFQARLACVLQGSTETTFYVLAVYFGSVGIQKTRYAVAAGLWADLIGIVAAILVSYVFFH
jgi:spore maturation protein SpmA